RDDLVTGVQTCALPICLYSGGGAWGDLALHATFIEKFATQTKLNLTSPIYAQEKTTYPFLFDFYAAQLVRFGFTLQAALVISGRSEERRVGKSVNLTVR